LDPLTREASWDYLLLRASLFFASLTRTAPLPALVGLGLRNPTLFFPPLDSQLYFRFFSIWWTLSLGYDSFFSPPSFSEAPDIGAILPNERIQKNIVPPGQSLLPFLFRKSATHSAAFLPFSNQPLPLNRFPTRSIMFFFFSSTLSSKRLFSLHSLSAVFSVRSLSGS